ncbi:hypothetical protein ACIBCO_34735 [Streptomyces violascens]|uniref:hypothetical protein n=1 Tax=Streptomyces violascens TaxID=67381 RepID=UPI0037B17090
MLATIVAVVGTLLGSIVTGVFQHLASGRTERAAAAQQLRRDQLDAITHLAAAGADYRRIMRKRGQARLNQASRARQEELRHESHVIRSALTQPMTALKVLIPDPRIHAAARAMVQAAYSIRDTADTDALNTAQEAARLAHDDFVNAAAQYVTGSVGRETRIARDGVGLPGADPTHTS